jgi:hypothetical protein
VARLPLMLSVVSHCCRKSTPPTFKSGDAEARSTSEIERATNVALADKAASARNIHRKAARNDDVEKMAEPEDPRESVK